MSLRPSKKIAAQWSLIPQELEHGILPSPFLSIAKLLEFPLPLGSTAVAHQPAQYFSKSVPDITDDALILRVRRLPVPDRKTVNKLLANSRQCWLDGVQSVVYSHLGGGAVTHFPLWIIT
ncbi:hypothetical protein B0H14DRAFT_3496633 [Mycena olivaceomarginata]|nr:hypothetical protein B0H14DRAFT_3496633 [Mycena olivaceomarginata]